MKPVIQQDITGCAVASAAVLSGISYATAKQVADTMGLTIDDPAWYSETGSMFRLLAKLGIKTGVESKPFSGWDSLPDCALLAIKWHLQKGQPYWHWVVFVRADDHSYVLDSKKGLKTNIRTDFGRIKPKWSIEVGL